jgi:aspartate dehydrogenase
MPSELGVAIGGLGFIGRRVAEELVRGIPGLGLSAVAARDTAKAERTLREIGAAVPILPLGALASHADIVVECVPAAHFAEIAAPTIEAGRTLVPLSVGALLTHWHLVERATETGARILVPTGALLGLDAVRAAAEGEIFNVTMVTRKPPGGLEGAPYLKERGISLKGLNTAMKVFDGTAREGARGFPANVNVAAALSLAGIGPDRTRLEIWADPAAERNIHTIEVDADSTRFTMTIAGVPSLENPRTGKLTPLSVIALLRGLFSPLRVGS